MHDGKPYVPSSFDIFSAGYILFALFTGRPPFGFAINNDDYYKEIINGNFTNYWIKT